MPTKKPVQKQPRKKPIAKESLEKPKLQIKDLFLKNYQFIIIIATVIALFFIGGSNGCNGRHYVNDTVVHSDTHYVFVDRPGPIYTPPVTNNKPPAVIPPQYKPSDSLDVLTKQYNDLASKFLAINSYRDSVVLKDTSGKSVGTVHINDSLTENKIKSRATPYVLNFPVITNTVTITEPYKPVNQVYVGGGITGNGTKYVNGAKVGVLLKNESDNILGLSYGGMYNGGLHTYAELSYYTKLQFNKSKNKKQ